jgi:hypothetical protein
VTLVRTDVSEERIAFITRVTKIGELRATLAVTSQPKHAAKKYSETSVLIRATRRHIAEDGILHRQYRLFVHAVLAGYALICGCDTPRLQALHILPAVRHTHASGYTCIDGVELILSPRNPDHRISIPYKVCSFPS